MVAPAERMAQQVNTALEWIEQHGMDLGIDQLFNIVVVGQWRAHRRRKANRPVVIHGHGTVTAHGHATLTARGTLTAHGVVIPAAA